MRTLGWMVNDQVVLPFNICPIYIYLGSGKKVRTLGWMVSGVVGLWPKIPFPSYILQKYLYCFLVTTHSPALSCATTCLSSPSLADPGKLRRFVLLLSFAPAYISLSTECMAWYLRSAARRSNPSLGDRSVPPAWLPQSAGTSHGVLPPILWSGDQRTPPPPRMRGLREDLRALNDHPHEGALADRPNYGELELGSIRATT
jgi:hypothetical protein